MAKQVSTSGINYVNGNYYQTEVRLDNDGTASGSYTTYRVNPDGSNPVPIYGAATVDGQIGVSINSENATPEEIEALENYDSELAQTQRDQVGETEGDFFGNDQVANPDVEGPTNNPGASSNSGTATQSAGSQAASGGGGGGLRYPADMHGDQDHIIFSCEEGSYPGPVILGIQPQLSDSNAVEWGGSTLNEIQKRVAQKALGALKPGESWENILKNLPGEVAKIAKENFSGGSEAGKMIKLWFVEQAMGLQGLSARSDIGPGAILNPNLELVFTGPTLRPFSFTFRMTPREKKESENIKQIIRFFKQNMAPRKSGSFVLKRPPYFTIQYKGLSADNGYLNKIKTKCALTNCSVDYTPDGSYMTYNEDGAMTAYNLTLQFQEVEPLYDEDYKDLASNIIGY